VKLTESNQQGRHSSAARGRTLAAGSEHPDLMRYVELDFPCTHRDVHATQPVTPARGQPFQGRALPMGLGFMASCLPRAHCIICILPLVMKMLLSGER